MSKSRIPRINQAAITGEIVQTPVICRCEKEGTCFSARVAVSRLCRDNQGQWQEEVSIFQIILREKLAEYYAERLLPGTLVFITGWLRSRPHPKVNEEVPPQVEIHVRSLQILEPHQAKE